MCALRSARWRLRPARHRRLRHRHRHRRRHSRETPWAAAARARRAAARSPRAAPPRTPATVVVHFIFPWVERVRQELLDAIIVGRVPFQPIVVPH
eukprot:scaffold122768_cov39-Phaeocystis_antarctica.AAC.1